MDEYQYILRVGLPPAPAIVIQPPDGGWTEALLERWLASRAARTPGMEITIDRRLRGDTGPFPGTTAPYLEWAVYHVDDEGIPQKMP